MFYELCGALFYKRPIVNHVNLLFEDNHSGKRLKQLSCIETLYLNHGDLTYSPGYDRILKDGPGTWQLIGSILPDEDLMMKEASDLMFEGELLQMMIAEGIEVMAKLNKVVVGLEGDRTWNVVEYSLAMDHQSIESKIFSLQLLSLKSVDHYCTTLLLGPLSLPDTVIKIPHPPKTYTFHNAPGFPSYETLIPPIVIGAVNRHIYTDPYFCPEPLDPIHSIPALDMIFCLANRLLAQLRDGAVGSDESRVAPIPRDQYGDTVVEIYDFIRPVVYRCPVHPPSKRLPTLALEVLNKILDREMGEWKGLVVLKSFESCPPCPCCGFDRAAL